MNRGHGAASPVESLEDVDRVYRDTRDKRGQAVVRCAYCNSRTRRVVREAARTWFISHACASPFAAIAKLSKRVPRSERVCFDLTEAQAAELWEWMYMATSGEVIYRGGRRHGLEQPTGEAIAHHKRIDMILVQILGGVPMGHRPGSRAIVVPIDELRAGRNARHLKKAA